MTTSENKGGKLGGTLFLGFFLVICVGIGALMTYSGVRDFIHTKASLEWLQTDGKVTKSKLIKSKRSSSSVAWHANIEYEYAVQGGPFKHYRASFGDYGSSDESHAQAILDRYLVGKVVPVYYKPNDPAETVLAPEGTKLGIIGKFIGGVVFMIFGAILALIPYLASTNKRSLEEKS